MRCTLVMFLLVAACGDEGKKKLGSTCEQDAECESGFCVESQCFEPEADSDGDGLINTIERGLGTSVKLADTDGDGLSDADEIGDVDDPRDSDGDGLIDAREAENSDADGDCVADQADPDDDDPNVPGNVCVAEPGVAVLVSKPTRDGYQGDVASLANGGFVASWSEGRDAGVPGSGGRTIAFFDADGREVARTSGIHGGDAQQHFPTTLVGLHNGDAVLGSSAVVDGSFVFGMQRYSAAGAPIGNAIELPSSANPLRNAQLVAYSGGNYGLVYVEPEKPSLTIRVVYSDDTLEPSAGGRALSGSDVRFDAVGLRDKTLVLSSEQPAVGGPDVLLLSSFGSEGNDEGSVDVTTAFTTGAALAARGEDEVVVIWSEPVDNSIQVAYRAFDSERQPVGDVAFLTLAAPGCPTLVAGGVTPAGAVYAALGEGECAPDLAGWIDEGTPVPLAFPEGSADVPRYSLRAASGDPVFLWVSSPLSGDTAGTYLQRFGADGRPTKITLAE